MLDAFRHIVHAAGYSAAGLRHLFKTEMASRIELALGLAGLIWFLVLGRTSGEIVLLAILVCLMLSCEALNTALERIVNHLSPEISDFARVTKDLGSAASFFIQLATGLYALAVTADSAGLIALWPAV